MCPPYQLNIIWLLTLSGLLLAEHYKKQTKNLQQKGNLGNKEEN